MGVPTYADSTKTDDAAYDDPVVRQAAVEALGRYNGAVVAVDPNTGRILTVVNQKIAFGDGYIPCSTIKPTIALAALEENVITRDTMLRVGSRKYMNLTEAMAHSNNEFFEQLGARMGFDTVSRYGRLLGLGELAGYNLPDEHPGSFPTAPPAFGGVARMSSFGEGIQVTPLQMASLAAAFANGGTLYYLQYPHSQEEVDNFTPRVKRELNIGPILPEIREGMLAAVLYGTGKSSYREVQLRPRRRRNAPRQDRDLRRPHHAVAHRVVHYLRRRDAPQDCTGRSAAREYAASEGADRCGSCGAYLSEAS
jgi:cell division protein FtsI/penicillin-binding protein 2